MVAYLKGLMSRLDLEKKVPDEFKTKTALLKLNLNAPYLAQGQPQMHHLYRSYLAMADAKMQGTPYEGTIGFVPNPQNPFQVKDYRRLMQWTEEKAKELKVFQGIRQEARSETRWVTLYYCSFWSI